MTANDISKLQDDMTGLVTIVTGASRGIGAAIALKLASLGAQIVVNYASNDKAAASIVGAIAEKHGPNKAIAVKADVSVEADCKRVVQTALEAFGRIDVLVNNAAIAKNTPLVDESLEIHDRIMAVNVNGTYLMTRAVVPVMSNGGSIIIISSTIYTLIINGALIFDKNINDDMKNCVCLFLVIGNIYTSFYIIKGLMREGTSRNLIKRVIFN